MVRQFGKVFLPRLIIGLVVAVPLILWINSYHSEYDSRVLQNQKTVADMQSSADSLDAQVDKAVKAEKQGLVEFNSYAKANDPAWDISPQQLHDLVWSYQFKNIPQAVADRENDLMYKYVSLEQSCEAIIVLYNSVHYPSMINTHKHFTTECEAQ